MGGEGGEGGVLYEVDILTTISLRIFFPLVSLERAGGGGLSMISDHVLCVGRLNSNYEHVLQEIMSVCFI